MLHVVVQRGAERLPVPAFVTVHDNAHGQTAERDGKGFADGRRSPYACTCKLVSSFCIFSYMLTFLFC